MNQEPQITDDELLALARAGRQEGFEGLFMRYGSRVYTTARRMLGEDGLAEDAVQEVFLQAFRSLERFRGDAKFSTWIHQITHNTCISKLRTAASRRVSPLEDSLAADLQARETPDAELILRRTDLQQSIQRALDALEPDHRAVLILCVIEKKSYSEIAGSTGQTEDQIRGKLYRARKAFLKHFRP